METSSNPPPIRPSSPPPGAVPPPKTGGMKTSVMVILAIVGVVILALPILALVGLVVPARARTKAMANAKGKAQEIACVNHLRQIGLAAVIHAADHNGKFPDSWLQVSNIIVTPNVLICVSDPNHTVATDWSQVGNANISYPFHGRGGNDSQTNRVLSICPAHGHVLLGDGSVLRHQQGEPPIETVTRDGILWMPAR